ncbi:MAG: tryptophan-rich sensory protein [Fulvivirga sp.]|uniref:tryptophan-rich sensory protein n=1 Tax=Fulvivirga sp. TaxID=1931237 RepID=UPI0032EDD5CF
MKLIYYRILNTVGLLVVIVTNYLANALPINGYSTGELSAFYPNLFVPAGITFSIWGIIYLLLIIFSVVQWKNSNDSVVKSLGWLFFINCLLNSGWIVVWHYRYVELSVLLMFGLLASLVGIYKRLSSLNYNSAFDKFIIKAPFNIYFGWICVATIANVTTLLVHWEFNPTNPGHFAVAMILATQVLVYLVNQQKANIFFTATIIWALAGIVYKRNMADGPEILIITSYAAIALSVIIYTLQQAKNRYS